MADEVQQLPLAPDMVLARQTLRLLVAFTSIRDTAKRTYLIEFIEGLAARSKGEAAAAHHVDEESDEAPSEAPQHH